MCQEHAYGVTFLPYCHIPNVFYCNMLARFLEALIRKVHYLVNSVGGGA
jgi:hypothetical protein